MSTEILSTSLGDTLVLKDVIPMAQGLGAAALTENLGPVRPTDWPKVSIISLENRAFLSFGGKEDNFQPKLPNFSDSVRITMGGDNTDGSESYDPFKRGNVRLRSTEDEQGANGFDDSVRITMGGINGDDTRSGGAGSPGSSDPFKKSEDERRGK